MFAEVAATDPAMAWIRQRLEDIGLLKFILVLYLRTQSVLLTQLVSLWREGLREEGHRVGMVSSISGVLL